MRVIAVIVVVLGIAACIFVSLMFDTQYAPGYTERGFRAIKLGDTEQRVQSLIGAPFSSNTCEPYVSWAYSQNKQSSFADNGRASGTCTTVTFRRGEVTDIFGQRQVSYNMFTLGDGQGFLPLTQAEITKLKGQSPDQIKQRFGAPQATYENKACKVLRYSRSPSSSSYRMRVVDLDADGKVVRTWRCIYQD